MPIKGDRLSSIGDKFGRLKITGFDGGKAICLCECGNISTPSLFCVRRGTVVSCGCYAREQLLLGKPHFMHGHGKGSKSSPTHNIWVKMRQRCENPKDAAYKNYGGRGIKVCERWQIFENFLSDMGERPSRKSIERMDNSKGYEPENCIWTDSKTQARNRRSGRTFSAFGEVKSIIEWTEDVRCVVAYATLHRRIRYDWSPERAITEPPLT